MGIFDMFRSGTPTAAVSAQLDPRTGQPMPANMQQQNNQSQQLQNTQNQQNQQQQPQQKETPPDPLAGFWDIDPKKDAIPADLSEFSFNFDPTKLDASFGKLDFTQGISPDLLKKVAAGGEDAVSSLLTIINHVGQQAAKTAVLSGTKITENGLRSTGKRMADNLPSMVKQHTISNVLREDNPLFTDPQTAPVLAAFESQIAIKFPNATPQEIREHSTKYFANFAAKAAEYTGMEISKPNKQATQGTRNLQTDWSEEPA